MEASISTLAAFLNTLPEPRIVLDADYNILAANEAYCRDFHDGRPISGGKCYAVSHSFTVPCDQAGEACPLSACRQSGVITRVLHLHHTSRGPEHVDVETTPIPGADGEPHYFVETMHAIRQASTQPAASVMQKAHTTASSTTVHRSRTAATAARKRRTFSESLVTAPLMISEASTPGRP